MPQFAYRRASESTGLWLTICLLGVAGQIGMIVLFRRSGWEQTLGVWGYVISAMPFLASLFIGWSVMAKRTRARHGQLARELDSLGFVFHRTSDQESRSVFAKPFISVLPSLGLRTGADGVRWGATPRESKGRLWVFEHEFVTGSGKTTQIHPHTIIVWGGEHPDIRDRTLPEGRWFALHRLSGLRRRALRDVELKDSAFDQIRRDWVPTGDATNGLAFLQPAVRAELERAPKGEAWHLGAGGVFMTFQGTLEAKDLSGFIAHAHAVVTKTSA